MDERLHVDERTCSMTDPTADEMAEVERQAAHDGLHHYPVPFLQHLIDSGEGWQSEGALGRAIVQALEDGTCVLGPRAHRDYHGNVVPARGDVETGAKGSIEYANRRRAERGEPALIEAPDGTVRAASS
jgi:hypothetical protein